jgi:hypothetical protein
MCWRTRTKYVVEAAREEIEGVAKYYNFPSQTLNRSLAHQFYLVAAGVTVALHSTVISLK